MTEALGSVVAAAVVAPLIVREHRQAKATAMPLVDDRVAKQRGARRRWF
ncbi:MAG: hypothetical protein QM811_10065 [Pirellulales bacterium]